MLKMSSVDGCILWGLRSKNTKPESDLMPLNDKRWLLHIRSASSASIRKSHCKKFIHASCLNSRPKVPSPAYH